MLPRCRSVIKCLKRPREIRHNDSCVADRNGTLRGVRYLVAGSSILKNVTSLQTQAQCVINVFKDDEYINS